LVERLQELAASGIVADPKPQYQAAAKERARAGMAFGKSTDGDSGAKLLLLLQGLFNPFVLVGVALGPLFGPIFRLLGKFYNAKALRPAEQMVAEGAISRLLRDCRPPVVFLRPFAADHRWIPLWKTTTPEEDIGLVVDNLGPFIAIGRPGERLPELGAHRLYVRDNEWQRVVALVIQESTLVILQGGNTRGVHWELETLLALHDPKKFMIYFHPRDRERHSQFREELNRMLPRPMPNFSAKSGFVVFGMDWTAHFHEKIGDAVGAVSTMGKVFLPMPLRP
jgi:hypothetical protein